MQPATPPASPTIMTTQPRLTGLVAAFAALLVLAPTTSQAQFGGLINKAKEKAAQQAGDKMGPVAPGEQVSDDLLGKVITGATAADRVLTDRDKVQAQRDAKNKELSALIEKNESVHAAYNTTNSKITECRDASFSQIEKARNEKLQAQMKEKQQDPAFIGKMQLLSMKYARQMADAQQKQDPVALQKVQRDMMMEVIGIDMFAEVKKDTAATDAKCGKQPAMPASLTQEEKLRADVRVADDSIRTLEAKAMNVGAQASGLEQIRYMQLKERTLSILDKVNGKTNSARFADDEMAAVQKHKADLEKLRRAL